MENEFSKKLSEAIKVEHLPSYIYGYPSKRAYQKFEKEISLNQIWANQKGNLNLYIHIPFCNYKCTYCTLLSVKTKDPNLQEAYVDALTNEIKEYGKVAGYMTVDSIYIGGGTPTLLSDELLSKLFHSIFDNFPHISDDAEISIEGSPETMNLDKLNFLKNFGINRVSMGIQTLNELELTKTGRQYSMDVALQAINNIKLMNYRNFNIDLIYGLEYQTKESWLDSLKKTIQFAPNSINIYPVVIRPLTDINKYKQTNKNKFIEDDLKYELYDESVKYLHEFGYRQESFVSFTNLSSDGYKQQVSDFEGNPLIGIGVGARSYNNSIQYSTDYAVTQITTFNIIMDYINKGFEKSVQYGFRMNEEEQKRRYVILTLLLNKLNSHNYKRKFKSEILEDFKFEFVALKEENCIVIDTVSGNLSLTTKGFKYSNIIGSLFYSKQVNDLLLSFTDK